MTHSYRRHIKKHSSERVLLRLFWAATFFYCGVAMAADLSYRSTQYGSNQRPTAVIALSGSIENGDTQKLAALVLGKHPQDGLPSTVLQVDTGGGDVVEAMRIAALVAELQMSVYVAPGGRCASACFFIFLEGGSRLAMGFESGNNRPGRVGLHRPYLTQPKDTSESLMRQNDAMKRVTSYLEKRMVPRRLIDLMMSHPSNDIYWMTTADLNEITEYTPEREELYIAKCNFDRRRINSLLDAEDRGDQRRVDLLNQELSNSEGCIQELRMV